MPSPQIEQAAASNRSEAQVRAALDIARAEDAYRIAYRESLKDGLSLETKAALILSMDDATDAICAARRALTAAKVAA